MHFLFLLVDQKDRYSTPRNHIKSGRVALLLQKYNQRKNKLISECICTIVLPRKLVLLTANTNLCFAIEIPKKIGPKKACSTAEQYFLDECPLTSIFFVNSCNLIAKQTALRSSTSLSPPIF